MTEELLKRHLDAMPKVEIGVGHGEDYPGEHDIEDREIPAGDHRTSAIP